jgi:hypothetical protein
MYCDSQIKRIRCAEYATCMEKMRDAYTIFVGSPEDKTPPERPRRRWITLKLNF